MQPLSGMNPELRSKWIAALRSGKYKQAMGQLRSEDKSEHCCLGVLCDVADIEIDDSGLMITVNGQPVDTYWFITEKLLGVVNYNDPFSARDFFFKNDSDGWTFERIADYAEGKTQNDQTDQIST